MKFCILYVFLGCTLFLHLRGRERLKLTRQLLDHSTITGPYTLLMHCFSAVRARPYGKIEDFPELSVLQENWQSIRDEGTQLLAKGEVRKAEKYNDIAFNSFFRHGWTRFYLKWYDDFLPSATQSCPKSVELVQSIPSVNAAMFAMLPAGSRLGRHRDPFAGSLRYHLGLDTPNSDACWIEVDGQRYSWRDGEVVVFDETYVHKAKNESDRDRLILFCDVTRPLRFAPLRAVNRFIIRHVAKITATQNTPSEKVGLLNHMASAIYWQREFFQGIKKKHPRSYHTGKWLSFAGIAYLIFFVLF
ncbi:MAG: aspartyl/asparaginyl beta-hydroxylase domain-containing protein [Planctomycetota bacterium]